MADIMLHTSKESGVTCVSNSFIDDFMKDANGEYVKIYLYLLRCLGREDFDFSISQLADCLDHTEKDVMRAITYWEKVGLLRLEYTSDNELSGICLNDAASLERRVSTVSSRPIAVSYSAPTAVATEVGAPVTATMPAPMKPTYSADELKAFRSDNDVQDVIFATQTYISRPLSTSETNTLLYWFDSLHMSLDLIEYLVESCLDNGHSSFHYMDTVARNWAEDGITSVEEAKAASRAHNNTFYSIMKAMGISNRELIPSEIDFINKWLDEYHFNIDIICEACKRTILSTNKPSFKYADSILTNWSKASVKSLEDIVSLDEKFVASSAAKLQASKSANNASSSTGTRSKSANNKFSKFSQRDYDFDALEKRLMSQN